ncbi:MAG: 2-hydroxyacyl-CoA dehydratase family protein [Thermodesulfobacteriota bacterium]|nr:2-hydroxyacyl-CoA dehydratase family protein [Thermodesulfobacteriota bacterium]
MSEKKPEKKKRLKTAEKLGKLMADYYTESAMIKAQKKPVAWLTSPAPVELCYAMDIFPVYPENYATMCAARNLSAEFCAAAEARGFSTDLCSYALNNLGSIYLNKGPFMGQGLPEPDMLIATEHACLSMAKWWEELSRHFQAPLFVVDASVPLGEEVAPYQVNYFADQLKELTEFMEKHSDTKLDMDRFKEVLTYSDEAARLFLEVGELRKLVPSPIGPIEMFTNMFPLVTLAGRKESVEFYDELHDEIKELADMKVPAVPNEKYRLIWDLFPVWYNLKLFKYLEEKGGVIVADVYATAFGGRIDVSRPFEGLAERYVGNPLLWFGVKELTELYKRLIQEYHVDGMIFHSNRSCRMASMGQYDVKQGIYEDLGIPGAIFETDFVDPRTYSDEQVKDTLDSFFEILEAKK